MQPGKPLTLLLTALDRWYDGRILEAALVLRIMSRTGFTGSLASSATAWRGALRRHSGVTGPQATKTGAVRGGAYRIVVDGDLRTRILMEWDGRLSVEIHPADRILILPSPPVASGSR